MSKIVTAKIVDAQTLKEWLERGQAVLVDVREPSENAAERISGSTLVPLSKVAAACLPDHAGKRLVLHCQKGGRGANACEKLLTEVPDLEVYNLKGGLSAWNAAGFPLEKSGAFFMALDRQVQLTIGICLLAATALAYFVNPLFLFVATFFGAGLTVAGLTGFCGLARVMALMPWNQSAA